MQAIYVYVYIHMCVCSGWAGGGRSCHGILYKQRQQHIVRLFHFQLRIYMYNIWHVVVAAVAVVAAVVAAVIVTTVKYGHSQ